MASRSPLPRTAALAAAVLAVFGLRVALVHAAPDLLHDLDAGETKHLAYARDGLPWGDTLRERLHTWLSGPENVHHGGFPMVSLAYAGLASLFGQSLEVLRLVPILATTAAAAFGLGWLRKDPPAAFAAALLLLGAPPLWWKWTCTARGGHLEAVVFPMLMLALLQLAVHRRQAALMALAGVVGGFSVYFSYLAAPAALLLGLGGVLASERKLRSAAWLGLGGLVGFLPWLLSWKVLELPYFDAVIHQTSNPDEAAEVRTRGLLATAQALRDGLPHNLWPWNVDRAATLAYQSETSDILTFEPTTATWASRAVVGTLAAGGLAASLLRRNPLAAAVCALPAVHHAFVLRLANTNGWPDVPHRYQVLVYPALALAVGLGVAAGHRLNKWLGRALLLAVAAVALSNLALVLPWLGPPKADWDVPRYAAFNLGQIRVEEAPAVDAALDQLGGRAFDVQPMLSGLYPGISEYYLLFRPGDPRPQPRLRLVTHELPCDDGCDRVAKAAVIAAQGRRDASPELLCQAETDEPWRAALDRAMAELQVPACPAP